MIHIHILYFILFLYTGVEVPFPSGLTGYGLNEEILSSIFQDDWDGPLQWSLKDIPNIEFYQLLHPFLKKWPLSHNASKSDIGRFYMAIDRNLRLKDCRADNIYRFIERISHSSRAGDVLMTYDNNSSLLVASQRTMRECSAQVEELNSEVIELKKELQASRKQLQSTRQALKDLTNESSTLKKQRDNAREKVSRFKEIQALLEEDIAELQEENSDLSKALVAVESELLYISEKEPQHNLTDDFTIQTKKGRTYSPTIRTLYYTLLANQVSASKITDIIKTVVKHFNPDIDVNHLKLPSKSCASYMRKSELSTISAAHKATILCQHSAQNQGFKLNTDGTTKGQKKIGGVAINDLVISVNEVPDGTADLAIQDISQELEKLRSIATRLNIPNANSINWTLLVSTNSDSAAAQKRLNRLIEERRLADEQEFGSASSSAMEVIECFCSMHLAINLRKAFLNALFTSDESGSYHPVDVLVHEFCKIFGTTGTPEYACGVMFADFLTIMISDASLSEESLKYYQTCSKIVLERQVGSRYFVTAANAMKIIYLRQAAIEFLLYTGKDCGTKLEKTVYVKLQDDTNFLLLKVDALMYYHVYADFVMMSKSTKLQKSVLDMNTHYLELKQFLEKVEENPQVVLQKAYRVFSDERLYGNDYESIIAFTQNQNFFTSTYFRHVPQSFFLY